VQPAGALQFIQLSGAKRCRSTNTSARIAKPHSSTLSSGKTATFPARNAAAAKPPCNFPFSRRHTAIVPRPTPRPPAAARDRAAAATTDRAPGEAKHAKRTPPRSPRQPRFSSSPSPARDGRRSRLPKNGSIAEFVGKEGCGRSRFAEKSKYGTFPLRLEVRQRPSDFHFFHSPGGGFSPLSSVPKQE
jgi:hypothetical protein